MFSELLGKRSDVEDISGHTVEVTVGDVTTKLVTVGINELREQSITEAKGVSEFVHDSKHVSFV